MKTQLTLLALILLSVTGKAQIDLQFVKANPNQSYIIFRSDKTNYRIVDSSREVATEDTNGIWTITNAPAALNECRNIIDMYTKQVDSLSTILYYFRTQYGNIGQDSVQSRGFEYYHKWYKVDKWSIINKAQPENRITDDSYFEGDFPYDTTTNESIRAQEYGTAKTHSKHSK